MSAISAPLVMLRDRLKARTDSEHEQAILRIVIIGVVLVYMAAAYSSSAAGHDELLLLEGLATALVLAVALFIWICVAPASNVPRRAIGMLVDSGIATFVMFLVGEAGVVMIAVYLFITFGNGFRYGRRYLFACDALCLVGLVAVMFYAPYWQSHRVTGWSLMIALMVLPLYVSTLLRRIEEARAKAEQALRECLDRERRAG